MSVIKLLASQEWTLQSDTCLSFGPRPPGLFQDDGREAGERKTAPRHFLLDRRVNVTCRGLLAALSDRGRLSGGLSSPNDVWIHNFLSHTLTHTHARMCDTRRMKMKPSSADGLKLFQVNGKRSA